MIPTIGQTVRITNYSYSVAIVKGELDQSRGCYDIGSHQRSCGTCVVLAYCGLVLPTNSEASNLSLEVILRRDRAVLNNTIVRRLSDDTIFFIQNTYLTPV